MLEDYSQQNIPAGTTIIGSGGVPTNFVWQWILSVWNRTGQGTGVPIQVDTEVVPAGATQATATALTVDWNECPAVAANSGVQLLAMQIGQQQLVFNGDGAHALKVYPPAGSMIDALGENAAYSLAAGKTQVFRQSTDTQLRSYQWG